MANEPDPAVAAPETAQPVAETPVVQPAPQTEAPAEPIQPELKLHTETPSLLDAVKPDGEAPKTEEAKTPEGEKPKEPEKKAEEPPKVEEQKPEAAAPEPFKFEPYTLPEGLQASEDRIGKLNEVLTQADLTPQQRGQALIDMHVAEMRNYDNAMLQKQHDDFAETRAGWRKQVMADPELGGAGHKTAMAEVARMRDKFVSRHKEGSKAYEADWNSWREFSAATGGGDHPAVLRFLKNVARWADEPAMITPDIRPAPDNGRQPKQRGRLRDLYQQN